MTLSLPNSYQIDFASIKNPSRVIFGGVSTSYLGEKPCSRCSRKTKNCCPKCCYTPYCGNKCWNADFTRHSIECGGHVVIEVDPKADDGYACYVFTTSLPPGHELFDDAEVELVFPTLPVEYEDFMFRGKEPADAFRMVCFQCHDHFHLEEEPVICKCGIQLCGIGNKCNTKEGFHTTRECRILGMFRNQNFDTYRRGTMRNYMEFYLDICVLRILVWFSTAASDATMTFPWSKFLLLASTKRYGMFADTDEDSYDGIPYMSFIKKTAKSFLRFSLAYAKYNREIIEQVYKIMVVFWEPEKLRMGAPLMSRTLHPDKNFMVQSYCAPNVIFMKTLFRKTDPPILGSSYVTRKGIIVTNKTKVKVTFDFSPQLFMPLSLRMIYLNKKGLPCSTDSGCTHCQDPSESGTHSGSIRCVACYVGIYAEFRARGKTKLPKRWTAKYVERVDWKCTRCGDVQPFSFILEVNEKIAEYFQMMKRRSSGWSVLTNTADFVKNYENSYLYPNHGLILQAKKEVLVAGRQKHFKECNLKEDGSIAVDFKSFVKTEYSIHREEELRLFPVKWDWDEFMLTLRLAMFGNDCRHHMEAICSWNDRAGMIRPENVTDRLEHQLLILLNHCFIYLSGNEIASFFLKVVQICVEEIQKPLEVKDAVKSGKYEVSKNWCNRAKVLSKLISKKEATVVAQLILNSMNISEKDFTFVTNGKKKASSEREKDQDRDNDGDGTKHLHLVLGVERRSYEKWKLVQ